MPWGEFSHFHSVKLWSPEKQQQGYSGKRLTWTRREYDATFHVCNAVFSTCLYSLVPAVIGIHPYPDDKHRLNIQTCPVCEHKQMLAG